MPRRSATITVTLALFLSSTSLAMAIDADALAARIKTVAAARGIHAEIGRAEASGDDVILHDVELTGGKESSDLGDITLKNVSGSTADGWMIGSVPIDDVEKADDKDRYVLKGIVIRDIRIAGTAKAAKDKTWAKAMSPFVGVLSMDSFDVTRKKDGVAEFTASDMALTNAVDDNGLLTSRATIGSFDANLATDPDDGAAKVRAVGYDRLKGSLHSKSSWNPESGDVAFGLTDLTVDKAGKLSIDFAAEGYTGAIATAVRSALRQTATGGKPHSDVVAAMALLMSSLKIDNFEVRFDDQSLTDRLLTFYADKNGVSKDQFVSSAIAMAPIMAAKIPGNRIRKALIQAMEAFLKDPHSLSVTAEPKSPVNLISLGATAKLAPDALPDLLALKIKANGKTYSGASPNDTSDPDSKQ